jgi:4-amino-4-deoxy-L-arabinose transferase-like glycosyltransferase
MTRETRRFLVGLAVIAAVGLAIRVAFMLVAHHPYSPHGDALIYHDASKALADGKGFVSSFLFDQNGDPAQAAPNPPLYLLWITIPTVLGFRSPLAQQLWSCVLGMGTIVLIGLVGRQLAGRRAGLIAAGIAAIAPNIFYWDTVILSETMSLLTATLVVLLAYRYWQGPSTRSLVLLGFACGFATFSRAELGLLIPLVLIPLAFGTRTIDLKNRLRRLAVAGLAALLVVTPWIAFNLSRFDAPVFLSNGFGVTVAATQCDDTYHGEFTGLWSKLCALRVERTFPKGYDESEKAQAYQEAALDYLGSHLDRAPVVVLARWGRALGVYRTAHTVKFDEFPEGRDRVIAVTGMLEFWTLLILSVFGVRALRRRKVPVYPLLALPAIALVAVTIAFASTRYRSTAEPALVVLSAIALDALIRRRRGEDDNARDPAVPVDATT